MYSSAFALAAFCSGPEWVTGYLHAFDFKGAAFKSGRRIQVFIDFTGCAGEICSIATAVDGTELIQNKLRILRIKVFTKLANRQVKGRRARQ